ncbi:hypothetical protein XBJ2_1860029 [Xenorhabdus bovienii str. Jollieti]|uniref:Uncharacterized protein n=7 Tax=Xenorhabdus bovienii TaxID=40576 RepID=A0A077QPX9_XENBV|nr:hypothetical protein XBJ1_3625 [Xenorhabdus bovienii SS-2004]CDG89621.1 hypothetical protein XBFFR1_2630016 [Xenorhabdus bovienii str. feltiae France]CDG92567.1 hypothetical protein XBFFL1_2240016 [Xenorhabdus bovienii str. feltiae Florida]CDG96192.1 hypothetical protein XBP1_1970014 [Xenorhabdus bovienii str. puntauvense]CDH03860.1 hypothetical protein XBFM1_860054 [Xenorhabdus bovienii str. feltiae Moldova]CDH07929.1 hypothetical protein XBO1_710010 [Xenorhabdus bovienii str. oregonense]
MMRFFLYLFNTYYNTKDVSESYYENSNKKQ